MKQCQVFPYQIWKWTVLCLYATITTIVIHAQNSTDHIDDETAYKKLYYAEKKEMAIKDGYIVVFNQTKILELKSNATFNEIVGNLSTSGGAINVETIHSPFGIVSLKVSAGNSTYDDDDDDAEQERRLRLLPWLKNALVEYMEQDQIINTTDAINQEFPPWGLDRIDQSTLPLNDQFHSDTNGTGVTVYVVDTGIRASHNDFTGRATCPKSFILNEPCTDGNGHGTHVAGTIGSNTFGVAKGVSLVGVKVLSNEGGGANSGVINGIAWVLEQALATDGPKVCNLSLGGSQSRALENAVRQLSETGNVFVSVAAGNEDISACGTSPAGASIRTSIISVGATDMTDQRASFSNFGSCVSIFAPGVDIESTWYTNDAAIMTISGTSMASPHVAGVAALYLQENPDALPSAVKAAILDGAMENVVSDIQNSPNLLLNTEFLFETIPLSPPTSDTRLSIVPVTSSTTFVSVTTIILIMLL